MQQYVQLLKHILNNGELTDNRTGVKTISVFGYQYRVDLAEGFPLLTTKKIHTKSVVEELLWMLSGSTDNKVLNDKGVTIWDEWATKEQCTKFGRQEGDLGPVYGHQWRDFGEHVAYESYDSERGFDQIAWLLDEIVKNPRSRRLIVTGWNPKEAGAVALPPCHTLFQFKVSNDNRLSCHLYQRSADAFLGVPFNLASYALLTSIVAHVTGLRTGEFIHSFGDLHVYENHVPQVHEQLSRELKKLPTMITVEEHIEGKTPLERMLSMTRDSFRFIGYDPHPAIRAQVAV